MSEYKIKPYCSIACKHRDAIEAWENANYGIKLDDIPFCACTSHEHMCKMYDILKKRHPTSKFYMVVKTKGIY